MAADASYGSGLIVSHWLGSIRTAHSLVEKLDWIRQAYTLGLNDFLQGPAIRGWVVTLDGNQWLETPAGKQWLDIPNGKEWLKQQQQKESVSKPAEAEAQGTRHQQSNAKTEGLS